MCHNKDYFVTGSEAPLNCKITIFFQLCKDTGNLGKYNNVSTITILGISYWFYKFLLSVKGVICAIISDGKNQ